MMQKHGDLPALRTAEKQALLDLEARQTAQIHAKLAQQYGEADRRASVLIGAAKARRERSDELLYKAEMAVIQEAKAVRAVEAATTTAWRRAPPGGGSAADAADDAAHQFDHVLESRKKLGTYLYFKPTNSQHTHFK